MQNNGYHRHIEKQKFNNSQRHFGERRHLLISVIITILSFSSYFSNAEAANVFKVGLPHVPGIMSRTESGEVQGFPLVLFEQIARDENIQFEWIDGSWSELFTKIRTGEIDVLPGTQETRSRQEILDFTDASLYTIWSELYILEQTDFNNILDLSEQKIGLVINDNNADGFLDYINKFNISIQPVYIKDHAEALKSLVRNEVYAIVGPSPNMLGELPGSVVSAGLYFNPVEWKYSFPQNKNELIRAKIDHRIGLYKNDPESVYYQLLNDFREDVFTHSDWIMPLWLRFVIYSFILIIGATLLFIVILRREVKIRTREAKSRNTYLYKAMEVGEMGIWEMNLETQKIFWSDEIYHFTGIGKQKKYLEKEDIKDFLHPEDIEDVISFFNNIKKQDSFEKECRIKNKNNQTIYIRLVGQLLKNNKNSAKKAIGIIQNVNRQKMHEHELILAKETAEKNEKLKSAFLANMSHEIRTPLNSIVGFSNLITSSEISEERKRDYVKIILHQNDILLTLINDIIDISKIDTDSLEIVQKKTDVRELLKGIYEHQKEKCPSKIEFSLDIQLNYYACIINTDQTRLAQILNNLISNAFKYTAEGAVILGCRKSSIPSSFDLYIKDTGIGISKSDRKLLFSRFTQIDNLKQGTGLGLAISQSLARLLGSELHVISEKGKGSEFYLSLPLFEAEN